MTARSPQLVPIAKLVAAVLVVLAIIWHQEHSFDSLRTEFSTEINRAETSLRAEISELRAQVAENGQRLARIEGFLEIGIPDEPPQ